MTFLLLNHAIIEEGVTEVVGNLQLDIRIIGKDVSLIGSPEGFLRLRKAIDELLTKQPVTERK